MVSRIFSQGRGWGLLAGAWLVFGVGSLTAQTTLSPAIKPFVGTWNFLDNSGWRSVVTLAPDGTVRDGDRRYGTWTVTSEYLDIHFDEFSEWLDRFSLPMSDNVLKGKHNGKDWRRMSLRSASAPAATYEALVGPWEYLHHDNGHRANVVFTPEGSITEDGKPFAYWVIENNRLYYSYIAHHDWVDSYALPPVNGVLTNGDRKLTLTRQKPAVSSTGSLASTAASTTDPAVTGSTVTTTARRVPAGAPGYFGTRNPVDDLKGTAAATPLPPLATPTATVPPVGSYATGSVPVSRTASTPAATPAPTVATATPAALTPVGRWKWHSGGERTITDKGAVLDGAKVVAQWKWQDKSKGQISVQFAGGAYRTPMIYTLSGSGNHLTGKSPASGNEHTEDRAE